MECKSLSDFELEIVSSYKYLEVILDEFLSFEKCEETLLDSAGRALGGVISKVKQLRNIGFKTYSQGYTYP